MRLSDGHDKNRADVQGGPAKLEGQSEGDPIGCRGGVRSLRSGELSQRDRDEEAYYDDAGQGGDVAPDAATEPIGFNIAGFPLV
jgi:hypothetical protein